MTRAAFTFPLNPFQTKRFNFQSVCRRSHLHPPPPTLISIPRLNSVQIAPQPSARIPAVIDSWETPHHHSSTPVMFRLLLLPPPLFSFDGLCLAAVDVGLPRDASIPPPRKPKRRSSIQMKDGVGVRVRVVYLFIRQLHSETVYAKLRIKFHLCYH